MLPCISGISLGLADGLPGLIANHISVALLPAYLAIITIVMLIMCERLNRKQPH